jgi:DNA-binding winged helix-turn-helix (wHTH) protein
VTVPGTETGRRYVPVVTTRSPDPDPLDAPEVLDLDGCRIDLHHRTVERDGALLPLTPNERDLLAYLAARRGRVVPVAELERRVWRLHPGVRTRAVSVTVRRLRRKIEADAAAPRFLRTVRGVGFALLADPPPLAPAAPLSEAEAAALYVARAREADPLYDAPHVHVVALVRALRGSPELIALAAGCARLLGPADVLARLAAGPPVPLPDGQTLDQRLRDEVARSWRALGPDERAAVRRCASLGERFSLSAAEALGCGAEVVVRLVDGGWLATERDGGRVVLDVPPWIRRFLDPPGLRPPSSSRPRRPRSGGSRAGTARARAARSGPPARGPPEL